MQLENLLTYRIIQHGLFLSDFCSTNEQYRGCCKGNRDNNEGSNSIAQTAHRRGPKIK